MAKSIIIVAALLLAGCASTLPQPDPWAPWYNIPRPTKCGPHCEEWREPGMMVKPGPGEQSFY